MFALSGHIMVLILVALGFLNSQPERPSARQHTTVSITLRPAKVAPATPAPPLSPASIAPASSLANPLAGPDLPATPLPPVTTQVSPPDPPPEAPGPAADSASSTQTGNASSTASAANSAPSVDIPYYYGIKQLSERPKVIEDDTRGLTLTLPGVETQNVILRLLINERGGVDLVEIEQSSLGPDIEPAVTGAFAKLRFIPGKIDGVAVKSQLKIEVSLENTEGTPLQRDPRH